MSAFQLTGYAVPADAETRVVLTLRTPGGDLPVQNATLDAVEATVGGIYVQPREVLVTPKMTGCEVHFTLPSVGEVALAGSLTLRNPDGSVWASVPMPETLPPRGR